MQADFMKSVRETLNTAQTRASERLGTLNGDAKKLVEGLVSKGKASQKDLSVRIQKLADGEVMTKRVKPVAEEIEKRGRAQAANVAGELRKLADRLEKISHKAAAQAAAAPSVQ